MVKHRSRESIKSFGSLVNPEKAEELKRTKTDIENNMTKILKLIKNEEQSKNDRNPKHSGEETDLVGLIEDLYNQYQSLYAVYDRLTGELGKVVSRRRNRRASLSSSDSDSEYFSPEEVDGNNRRSEKEHHNVSDATKQKPDIGNNTDEVLNTEASAEAKEFEEQLTSKMKEMENLSQQKRNLELQVESQEHEVKELSAKNTGLQYRVLELELLLKEKNSVVSILQTKLKNNENQAKSNIAELMAQVNKLELEAKSLQTQKDEMEEKIKCDKNEALTQRKELIDQLNVMQQNLNSLCNQNKELEDQMERKREETSQYLIQIEDLKGNLDERNSVEQIMLEEKESFLARIKDLELELETRETEKNELEEQLRDRSYEIKQMEDENKALQDRNHELKGAMTQRGDDISAFLREHESDKNGASVQVMALNAEVNGLRLELDALQEQKSKLEQQNERSMKEHAESLAKMENLNVKLSSQIADQAATIERISAEHKEAKILSNKFKLNRQSTERKMEELAQEFRKKMEDNIRLLHQRIHVAEQLNNENKNSCKMTKQRYEQENKMLGEKIASYEEELRTLKVSATPSLVGAPNGLLDLEALNGLELDVLNGLDLVAGKVEEHKAYVMNRVSKLLCEVQFAKDWIKKRNDEMKKLKDNVDGLTALLNSKEEQEFLLREKVWELEAKVSKEGGEKLNLTKAVSQLEKKVGKLEKNLKEKDEDLVSIGEKKREAIRQLCFVVDFHRDRCNYLKDLVTKMRRANNRT